MARTICPICQQSCDDAEFEPHEGRQVCPRCAENLRIKHASAELAEMRDIRNRYPRPPRRITPAVRAAYLRQNSLQRLWLYIGGALTIALIPALRYWSENYELLPLTFWYPRMALLMGLPEHIGGSETYAVQLVYHPGVDVFYDEHPGAGIHGSKPDPRGIRGPKPFATPLQLTSDEARLAQLYMKAHQGFTYVHVSPRDEREFVGQWANQGQGLPAKIVELQERHANLGWPLGSLAVLGWVSALAHHVHMLKKVRIYRDGVFVLATESARFGLFQNEILDKAIDFTKVAKIWTILKLHINVIYLVRTPHHPDTLVLQLAKHTEPWYVDGKLVVCYLPNRPGEAVLVPSDVGLRLALEKER